jgi:SAM-dependent methyltransferase
MNAWTGSPRIWYKEQMQLHYIIDDIRSLPFGREFDIVLSVGLLEHFPDEHKPEVLEWHRKFLKPGGYAIMTTPRNQVRARLFYRIMEDVMNHTYRELMTVPQMGLYVYENGFDILRHGIIKAHNGIIARPR